MEIKKWIMLIPKSYCVKSFWNLFVWEAKSPKLLKSVLFESSTASNQKYIQYSVQILQDVEW